jgi:hypothetical protein
VFTVRYDLNLYMLCRRRRDRLCALVGRVPGYRSRGPGFDSPALPDFLRAIEELLGRKCSSSGLESRGYARAVPSPSPLGTLYPQKLSLTSLAIGGRSVGIARSRTQAAEFRF